MIQTVGPKPIVRADHVSNVPAGGISAVNIQNTVNELDTEKAPLSSPTFTGVPAAPTASANTNTTQIATTAFAIAQDSIIPSAVADPTGFASTSTSTLSFNSGTRIFTIAPTGSSFDFWVSGNKFTKTSVGIEIPNTHGKHYVYFNASGDLATSNTFFDLSLSAPVAMILWDAIGNTGILFDERHGISMSWSTHKHLHLTQGTLVISGFTLSGYTLNTTSDDATTWGTASGMIADEDLYHTLSAQGESNYLCFYRTGEGGVWRWSTNTFPFFHETSSYIRYNLNNAGTWSLSPLASAEFVNYYIIATPAGIGVLPGQSKYSSLSAAQSESILEYGWGSMPFAEVAPLYKLTFRTHNTYNNTGKVQIQAVERLIGQKISISGVASPTDHASLTGLTGTNVHPASSISSAPYGGMGSTNVQSALEELELNKARLDYSIYVGSTAIRINQGPAPVTLSDVGIFGNAGTVSISADNSSDETRYPLFAASATGGQSPRTDTGFTYNPNTGNLTVTTVTGNVTGSSGSCTGNAATATKASQDSDGNPINTTYLKLGGGTMTGVMNFNVGTVAAGATITIPNGYQIITITDDSASAANAITMPTGVNGQLLIIYNGDAQATSGAFIIPAGYMEAFVYLIDSWKPLRGIVG